MPLIIMKEKDLLGTDGIFLEDSIYTHTLLSSPPEFSTSFHFFPRRLEIYNKYDELDPLPFLE